MNAQSSPFSLCFLNKRGRFVQIIESEPRTLKLDMHRDFCVRKEEEVEDAKK
jgi:hypothetical protein